MYSPKHFLRSSPSFKFFSTSMKLFPNKANVSSMQSYCLSPNTSTFITPIEASRVIQEQRKEEEEAKAKTNSKRNNFSCPASFNSKRITRDELINQKLFKTIFAQSEVKKKRQASHKNSKDKKLVERIDFTMTPTRCGILYDSEMINKKIIAIKGKIGFIKRVYDYVYPQTMVRKVCIISTNKKTSTLKPLPPLRLKSNDIYSLPDYTRDREASQIKKYLRSNSGHVNKLRVKFQSVRSNKV